MPIHDWLQTEAAGSAHRRDFVPGMTGLRALAALLVLLHHLFAFAGPRVLAWEAAGFEFRWHWLLTVGWIGANVFFVLSGFLLATPFVGSPPSPVTLRETLRYGWRRVRRVVPAYWAQIGLLVGIAAATSTFPGWDLTAAHMLFLQNFRYEWSSALNGVYWTLPTEFGFYLLLPGLAVLVWWLRAMGSRAWVALGLGLIGCAIAWRLVVFGSVSAAPIPLRAFVMLQLPGVLDHFGIGILLAWLHARAGLEAPRASARQGDCLAVLGLLGMIACMRLIDAVFPAYWEGHPMLFFGYTLTAFFIGLVVYGTAIGGPLTSALFANSAMLSLGIVSYSLYLWHIPIISVVIGILDGIGMAGDRLGPLLALAVPLSIAVAALSYALTERPFLPRASRPRTAR